MNAMGMESGSMRRGIDETAGDGRAGAPLECPGLADVVAGGEPATASQPAERTVSGEFVVGLAKGLHLRPADMLAREARRWRSRVDVIAKSQRVDGKSILDVMTLAAEAGSRVVIEVTGPDAVAALAAISDLFARNFDETGGVGDPADGEPFAAGTG